MKMVDGYVVTARTSERLLFFGTPETDMSGDAENLETNGLVPIPSLGEARFIAGRFLNGRRVLKNAAVGVGRIRMEIAEDESDLDAFRRKRDRSFVVIFAYGKEVMNLLGRRGPTTRGDFDSGGRVNENAAPFEDLEEALRLASEARRQGESPAAVAWYRLRALKGARRA
jgi:hypothetical protein